MENNSILNELNLFTRNSKNMNQNDILNQENIYNDFYYNDNLYHFIHNSNRFSLNKIPNFSIIIPVLDEEKIITNTLKLFNSELKEKYNYEIIISDGGSTDNTIELAKNYSDIIVQINNQYKQTIAEGRNVGSIVSNSNYIVFMNIDSYPQNIETFLEQLFSWSNGYSKLSEYDAITCKVNVFENEKKLKDNIFYFVLNNYFRILNLLGIGMARGECILVNKHLFFEYGGFNPKLAAGEDFDLFYRIAKKYKTYFAKELVILESPRRFRKNGYLRTLGQWFLNSIYVIIFGKSYSVEWEKVR